MNIQNTRSGDHLRTSPGEPPAVVSDISARQGVTGHNVRYVLLFGLGGALIALAAALAYFGVFG